MLGRRVGHYFDKMYMKIVIFLAIACLTWGKDYYELLEVSRTADEREIRRAFKKLAVTQHPDKNNDDPEAHQKFILLTTAYEVLKDRELRKKYDLYGEKGLDNSNKRNTYHSWSYYHDNFGIYDDDPEIITLNRNDYFESIVNSDKMWLVNFYSTRCSHCHHLAPTWRKIAKELEGVVKVGAVNCEDDWQLCHQVGIQSYPTILHYPKNSKHGIRYTGEHSYSDIIRFVLDRLDAKIHEISQSLWTHLLQGNATTKKPILVFTCGTNQHCFTSDERLKVAATFDKMIDVQIFSCKKDKCDDLLSQHTNAVYFTPHRESSKLPVLFENVDDINTLVERILEQFPDPQDLNAEEFWKIREVLKKEPSNGWLICFYMGHATELDLILKRLPNIVNSINLGKVNCGRYSVLCNSLNINRYPTWGVLKPGGAFEQSHGKNTINDISKFADDSVKAKNVWALSADKILSILQRTNDDGAWFLDWYAPWCPPCMQFLPELRKASVEFEKSTVQFGTIDCTVHATICRDYNIRSYPTAMLINGSSTLQFTMHKTAANVAMFIQEAQNPTVIQITSKNFNQHLVKKKSNTIWVVDYFAPWCGPCQQLAPEWTAVAKALRLLTFVNVANINCETEGGLCKSQAIQSYPTIRIYPTKGEGLSIVFQYSGQRNSASILKWIAEFLPKTVYELTPTTFQKDVFSSKHVWIVDFYAPWCGHCQVLEPQFAIAAQLFEKKVRFARMNCDVYSSFCAQAEIRSYPTLMIYSSKHNRKQVSSGFRINANTAETINREVLAFIESGHKYSRDEL